MTTLTRAIGATALASIALLGISATAATAVSLDSLSTSAAPTQPVGQETMTFTNRTTQSIQLSYSIPGDVHREVKVVDPGQSWDLTDWAGKPRSVYHFTGRYVSDLDRAFTGQVMYNRGQGFVGMVFLTSGIDYCTFSQSTDGAQFAVLPTQQ